MSVKAEGKWLEVDHTYLNELAGIRHLPPRHYAMAGFVVSGTYVFVSAKGPYNAFKALVGRGLRPTKYGPSPGAFSKLDIWAKPFLSAWIDGYDPNVEEWLAHVPPSRRVVFEQAYQELLFRGYTPRLSLFAAFIKMECLDGNTEELIDRMIQAPTPAGLRAVGPSMWSLTKSLKKVWNIDAVIFYASVAPTAISEWFNRYYIPGMIAGLADITQFDGSYSCDAWDFVYRLYAETGMFNLPFVKDFLRDWKKPKGKMLGRGYCYKYETDFMNASGRPDTALANALLNGLITLVSLTSIYHDIDVTEVTLAHVNEASAYFKISVVGDDSLFLATPLPCYTSEDFKGRYEACFATYGFALKMATTYDPFSMVYLGMRPYRVGSHYYFSRTVGRALFKYSYVLHPEKYDLMAWFHGKLFADAPGFRCIPVLAELMTVSLNYLEGQKRTAVPYDENKPWLHGNCTPDYDIATKSQFCAGYQILEAELDDLVQYILSIKIIPCVISHPTLTRICEFDDR